jgi:hypothetical protein
MELARGTQQFRGRDEAGSPSGDFTVRRATTGGFLPNNKRIKEKEQKKKNKREVVASWASVGFFVQHECFCFLIFCFFVGFFSIFRSLVVFYVFLCFF